MADDVKGAIGDLFPEETLDTLNDNQKVEVIVNLLQREDTLLADYLVGLGIQEQLLEDLRNLGDRQAEFFEAVREIWQEIETIARGTLFLPRVRAISPETEGLPYQQRETISALFNTEDAEEYGFFSNGDDTFYAVEVSLETLEELLPNSLHIPSLTPITFRDLESGEIRAFLAVNSAGQVGITAAVRGFQGGFRPALTNAAIRQNADAFFTLAPELAGEAAVVRLVTRASNAARNALARNQRRNARRAEQQGRGPDRTPDTSNLDVPENLKLGDTDSLDDLAGDVIDPSAARKALEEQEFINSKGRENGFSVATASVETADGTEHFIAVSGNSLKKNSDGSVPDTIRIGDTDFKVVDVDSQSIPDQPNANAGTNFNHAEKKLFSFFEDTFGGGQATIRLGVQNQSRLKPGLCDGCQVSAPDFARRNPDFDIEIFQGSTRDKGPSPETEL